MDIPFTTRTLANGLEVVVHEDRHIPMAAVSVWYHVGSRHEVSPAAPGSPICSST